LIKVLLPAPAPPRRTHAVGVIWMVEADTLCAGCMVESQAVSVFAELLWEMPQVCARIGPFSRLELRRLHKCDQSKSCTNESRVQVECSSCHCHSVACHTTSRSQATSRISRTKHASNK